MSGGVTTVELWDGRCWPGRIERGIPTFQFRCAPQGLLTRRQLRAAGLAPGGQEPWARLVWCRNRRFAWLYRVDLATPKRTPTPAQLAAVEAALAARRVCAICGPVDHIVRTSDQLCGDCYAAIHSNGQSIGQAHRPISRANPSIPRSIPGPLSRSVLGPVSGSVTP